MPGGWWKASRLKGKANYGLISEAVSPGFEYADNEIATEEQIQELFPEIKPQLDAYIKRN